METRALQGAEGDVPELSSVDWAEYDFVDMGCSTGGSLHFCQRRFGAKRGLGVDLDQEKVIQAREKGFDAVLGDALQLPSEVKVSFVSMMDFLEHLPDLHTVRATLEAASRVASDFLFIRHPSFEGEAYLTSLGLRQYWWNWRGHTAHIRVADYCTFFNQLGLHQYVIQYRQPITSSNHPSVLPLDTPCDQHEYDPTMHPFKLEIEFAEPLWRAQDIFVALRTFTPEDWKRIIAP